MIRLEGRLLLGGELVAGRIEVAGERIHDVVPGAVPGERPLPVVAPGLIDLHVHGWGGHAAAEAPVEMARALAAQGTTGFLATLFPDEPGRLGATAERVWASRSATGADGAALLGLHLEGPFVNPRAAGSLPGEHLAVPSPAALRAILGSASGDGRGVRAMTLAPELPGAADLVAELARAGVRASLGHSLARAAEARAAEAWGATGATHLFNAMTPLHHREVGLAGHVLVSEGLVPEIIGDLVHVGAEAFELALRARGPAGLALVSDALAGAGSGCDVFHSHGHRVVLRDGAAWIDARPPRLAGAAASQLEAVGRLVRAGVVSLADALRMASEVPAGALGLADRGVIARGARADFVVLDEGPAGPVLREVWVGGRRLDPPTARKGIPAPGAPDPVRGDGIR